MKIVIYIDTADSWKIKAAGITAFSVKRNGNLENSQYILYSPEYEIARNQEIAKAIFDRIEPPPLNGIFEKIPQWQKTLEVKYCRECWTKFICLLNTPTEGEEVALLDWDVLCTGDITAIAPPPGKILSIRMGVKKGGGEAAGANGGVVCKSADFDNEPDKELFTQPLFNGTAWAKTRQIWRYSDEAGLAWYMHLRGKEKINKLEMKYNFPAVWHAKSGRNIAQNDTRIIHFMGANKPWKNRSKRLFWLFWRYDKMTQEMMKYIEEKKERKE